MSRSGSIFFSTWLIVSMGAPVALAAQRGQPQVHEPGFHVTHFDQCGYQGRVLPGRNGTKPPRGIINDIECSPGGDWGNYVYLAVYEADADFDPTGIVERVNFTGKSSAFRYTPKYFTISDLSFTPAGWRGGQLLLETWNPFIPRQNNSALLGENPVGTTTGFAFRLDALMGSAAADPTGAFGSDLFYLAANEVQPGGFTRPSGIYRLDAAGVETLWASPIYSEMRFGPGGDWGSDLYAGGMTLTPDGTATPFPTSFSEFDWVSGPGFDGDMFAFVAGEDAGTIFRVKPDGTRTVFATRTGGNVASCGDALWIANQDGCFVVQKKAGH